MSERNCGSCVRLDPDGGYKGQTFSGNPTGRCRWTTAVRVTDTPTLDCRKFEPVRMCGDCVVYNDCGDQILGGCSIHPDGYVGFDEAACNRFFPKTELNAPLYGKKS